MNANYAQKCQEYIDALQGERRKIQVFERELPLCLELVTRAIDTCRQQMIGTTEFLRGQSECSEQTSSEGPVLEQFIPIKRASSCEEYDDDDDEQHSHKSEINNGSTSTHTKDDGTNNTNNFDKSSSKKSDWLRSVQLWNPTPDPPIQEDSPKKVSSANGNGGGAFQPFKKEKNVRTDEPASTSLAALSTPMETNGNNGCGGGEDNNDKGGQSLRKARRCWSPELHRRFLNALQQLGGSHVATPKQIRELMKVDGLTNDEVKSHLQKYRLHTRRPSASTQNSSPQPPQFVVVGGIWVPPPEYAAAGAAAATASGEVSGVSSPTGIYAPIASLPPIPNSPSISLKKFQNHNQQNCINNNHSNSDGSQSEGRVHSSNSPATSSSTHTTTASPNF